MMECWSHADVARKTRDRLQFALQAEIKKAEAPRQATKRNSRIPVEVSYPVIDEVSEPPVKHGLSVRLNMKVTPEVLRAISLELKSQETTQYEFTYLFYYLPGNGPEMGLDMVIREPALTFVQL
jgi:hypothetical protein